MNNLFNEIEDEIFINESIIFNKQKIKEKVNSVIFTKLNEKQGNEKHFLFEEIIFQFFEYLNIPIVKTKKTRDFGIDGIIKLNLELLGEIDLGIQIKDTVIDSMDIDNFLSSLKNSELRLGLIICNKSRNLQKYELNTKIRAILLSKGIKIKENLINQSINLNPIFILKTEDILDIYVSRLRGIIESIYKK
ncbi:MAG: restriction endonuclease [Nanoarchaeota archaeon]